MGAEARRTAPADAPREGPEPTAGMKVREAVVLARFALWVLDSVDRLVEQEEDVVIPEEDLPRPAKVIIDFSIHREPLVHPERLLIGCILCKVDDEVQSDLLAGARSQTSGVRTFSRVPPRWQRSTPRTAPPDAVRRVLHYPRQLVRIRSATAIERPPAGPELRTEDRRDEVRGGRRRTSFSVTGWIPASGT